MTRPLQPCGTPAARNRHRRRGEPVDQACHEAHKADCRRRYRRRHSRLDADPAEPLVATPRAVAAAVDVCGLDITEAAEALHIAPARARALLTAARRLPAAVTDLGATT